MRKLTRTATAEQDLETVLGALNAYNPATADRFAADFEARCALLPSQPHTGRDRGDLAPGLRSVVVGKHLVFFASSEDEVVIVRVLHGARNITPDMFANP